MLACGERREDEVLTKCPSSRNSSPHDAAILIKQQVLAHELLPLGQGSRAAGLVGLLIDEVTFLIEMVVC